jgi:hypothetical protein
MAAFVGEPDMQFHVGSLLLTNRDRLGYLQFGQSEHMPHDTLAA